MPLPFSLVSLASATCRRSSGRSKLIQNAVLALNASGHMPRNYQHRIFATDKDKKEGVDIMSHLTDHKTNDAVIPGLGHLASYGSLGDPNDKTIATTRATTPWQAERNIDVQRVTQKAMIYELIHEQTRTIENVVPWFLENMPSSYFQQVPERYRFEHIKAIAAIQDANMDKYMNLKSHLEDGRIMYTFIRPSTQPGTLLRVVRELPSVIQHSSTDQDAFDSNAAPLSRVHVFSTKDDSMSLDLFVVGQRETGGYDKSFISFEEVCAPILAYADSVQKGNQDPNAAIQLEPSPLFERQAMMDFMKKCSPTHIRVGAKTPDRFLQQRMMVNQVLGTESTRVHISKAPSEDALFQSQSEQGGHYWVDYVVSNSLPQVALEDLCRLLYHHKFDVGRARLDTVAVDENHKITLLRALVTPAKLQSAEELDAKFELLKKELIRSKWLDIKTLDMVVDKFPWLGITRGEIISAFTSLLHPVLAKENAVAYSKANIRDTISNQRFLPHAAAIADLFIDRFNPESPLVGSAFEERYNAIAKGIGNDVEDRVATEILLKMLEVCRYTLKTNLCLSDRYALALRLDPRIMLPASQRDQPGQYLPYGIIFVHGRRFDGYHVRFRDIARGGMRLVTPRSPEQYALESARHYDECYGLAFAQQLKNKDIPEGGSKAVALIDTTDLKSDQQKSFTMRKCVKAFSDSILDLIVDSEETRSQIVDYWGKKEVLYLGPDEQVIPQDIEWIVKRAAYRGYRTPAAFMSSKPRAGINHKEFGVTSESVNRYLDVALRRVLDIDPKKDSFSVKLTGGPAGDVAGNEIKILIREYGPNVKIVGIADHSGCAEDPVNGLDHDELLRLVRNGLDIASFNPNKLSKDGGVLHKCDTDEGVKARNTMHFRLKADAFVPCGGRPNTIDISNYKQFLLLDGTPSSPLIVEGANLFVTAEARKALFDDAGVAIVKDSSANKGGVITSSYEICAAMLLTEEEFFANKKAIVEEVIAKVQGFAEMEAELLFREYHNFGRSLPEVSQNISQCINNATDALSVALDTLPDQDRESLLPLFKAHLPKTMADIAFGRVKEQVPDQYIKNAISSCLASKLVYKEGTKFVEAQPQEKLAAIALQYVKEEKKIAALIDEVRESQDLSEEEKERITELLEKGGARTSLSVF